MLSKPKGVRWDYVTYVHEAIAPELTSAVYSTMAKVFERRKKPDKAMSYVEKSIVLLRDMDDRQALAERLFQLSEMKLSAGEKSEAMKLKEEGFRVLNGKPPR